MDKTIAVIGAFDTKGKEFTFVKSAIEERGYSALMINVGVLNDPPFEPDVSADEVATAGGSKLAELRENADRGMSIEIMSKGIGRIIKKLHESGRIQGVLAMGGSAGTEIGSAGMRALPLGIPKVMVSTLASGDTKPYIRTRDIVMIPSIVDVAGVNRISARAYLNAVGALVGMMETPSPKIEEKPLLAASMFGNTTPVVNRCREILEEHGYEVLIFHAVGTPETLEALVAEGYMSGVLDITTTEWADEITGGVLPGGPNRYNELYNKGIPQVIVPGCVDMVNFWARETVPERFQGRLFYQWAPNVTLMRTTPEENATVGRVLAQKANQSKGSVAFFLPLKGVSMLDAPGKEFWWPEADSALFDAIKNNTRPEIPVYEMEYNINDSEFAEVVANKMLEFLRNSQAS